MKDNDGWPTQPLTKYAQMLWDDASGGYKKKKKSRDSQALSQTHSQILRGAAQKPAFPRESVQGV